jgi:hypothetical protein
VSLRESISIRSRVKILPGPRPSPPRIALGAGSFAHHGWTVASGLILLGAREGWPIDEERQRFPPDGSP